MQLPCKVLRLVLLRCERIEGSWCRDTHRYDWALLFWLCICHPTFERSWLPWKGALHHEYTKRSVLGEVVALHFAVAQCSCWPQVRNGISSEQRTISTPVYASFHLSPTSEWFKLYYTLTAQWVGRKFRSLAMDDVPPSYETAVTRDYWSIVAKYIPSHDLCSAALVCRTWHQIFAPQLWGNPASHFGVQNDMVYGRVLF